MVQLPVAVTATLLVRRPSTYWRTCCPSQTRTSVCQPAVMVGPLPEAGLSTLACRPQSLPDEITRASRRCSRSPSGRCPGCRGSGPEDQQRERVGLPRGEGDRLAIGGLDLVAGGAGEVDRRAVAGQPANGAVVEVPPREAGRGVGRAAVRRPAREHRLGAPPVRVPPPFRHTGKVRDPVGEQHRHYVPLPGHRGSNGLLPERGLRTQGERSRPRWFSNPACQAALGAWSGVVAGCKVLFEVGTQ